MQKEEAFILKIAGLKARVLPNFCSTRQYCRNYLAEGPEDLQIEVTEEAMAFEQAMLDREAAEEGWKRRQFTPPFLERAVIQRAFAEALALRDTLLLHGSTVAVDGQAYLFTASCGQGKSTHTRLWREVFGARAVMVNDDKPFLRRTEAGFLVCGSPFSGKHGLDSNVCLPLKGICILRRGPENRIHRIGAEEAAEMLTHQTYMPLDPAGEKQTQKLLRMLMTAVPLWSLTCTKDPEAAKISYEAMATDVVN